MLALRPFLFLTGLLAIMAGPVTAGGETVTVTKIENAGIIHVDLGPAVRLTGLHIPPDQETQAREWLESKVNGKKLDLTGSSLTDRHGRRRTLATLPDGSLAQEGLLGAGLAFYWPEEAFPDEIVHRLEAAESQAMAGKKGLWNKTAVLAADDPAAIMARRERFAVVEGLVISAAKKNGRLYLNFGPDWKTDFTLILPPKADIPAPGTWVGKRLRARGWIESINGPAIEIRNPSMIRTLPAAP